MTSLPVRTTDTADHDLDFLDNVLSHRGGAHAAPGRSNRWLWISFLVLATGALGYAAMQLLTATA